MKASAKVPAADIPKLAAVCAAVQDLCALHTRIETPDDPWVDYRCSSCIAGYDPATGELVKAAWPCASARILQGIGEVLGV